MLLEYNEDTNEDTIHERAIQLRHVVASRKLEAAAKTGELSVDGLLFMRERNREARKDHGKDELDLTEFESKERVSLYRTDQHFRATNQVTVLGKDVARASRLTKARVDSLNDLEKRIMAMRSQLHVPQQLQVDTIINTELQTNNRLVKLEGKFEVCETCGRRILSALLPTHNRMCEQQAKEAAINKQSYLPGPTGVDSLEANLVTSLATFKPQPPRNFRIKQIGISFITWEWDPPVIDGGLEITDYEIGFEGHFSVFQRELGKFKKWEEPIGPFRTSSWLFRNNPVCHTGYKIMGLRADTEYVKFNIRSHNLRGWSEWVPMQVDTIPPVLKTLASVPASPPLFVTCEKITASCLHLSWSPPLFDGGTPVVDYFVYYTVVEMQITVTARDVRVEKKKNFCTETTECEAVIRHLPEDSDIIEVYVVARNYDWHMGEQGFAKLPKDKTAFRTTKSCRHSQLLRELEYASGMEDEWIDSTFFTGIRQRVLRVEHMRQLKEELEVTPPDPYEVEETKEWAAIVEKAMLRKRMEEEAMQMAADLAAKEKKALIDSAIDDDAKDAEYRGFSYQQRREHYERKIKALEQKLVSLSQERQEIDRKRIMATMTMRQREKRTMELQVEKERLKDFPGAVVTSSVLVGSDMQYKLVDFRLRVDRAIEESLKEVAALKFSVISGENRRQQIKHDLVVAEEQQKERRAKFHEFESNYHKTMKIMKRFNPEQSDDRIKLLYFRRFQQYRTARQELRAKISHTFKQVIIRYLRVAFHKWKTGEDMMSSNNTKAYASVGGLLLQKAFEKRQELQSMLRATISDTAIIQQKLELSQLTKDTRRLLQSSSHFKWTEEGIDHQKLFNERGLTLLYEADGYAQANKFLLAAELYEAQILLIRSSGKANAVKFGHRPRNRPPERPGMKDGTDVKSLAICHGRLGKMFAKLGNASRAIVEFDRQLSLAREIHDSSEESDAFYGLGAGYFQQYDYDSAIHYLTIAQAQYLSLGRMQRYIWTLRTLKECYSRLNKPEKVAVYEEKLNEAENSSKKMMQVMHRRLDDMKSKLVHSAAEIELIVNIERTTYRALELKQEIAASDSKVKEVEAEIEAQEQQCLEIVALLEAIQKELDEAMKTDASEMWSALVHDQPQVVEVEELKTRLKQRQPLEVARLEAEKATKKNLLVRLKNLENTIMEADQHLALEEGALMKHARLDRSFRCVALCSANVAGNEVTGTATGGFEEFAAAEGCNIHLIDYHSGELLHMFLGGNEETGHTGVVTCLLHDGHFIFSGATDEIILCWDTVQRKLVHRLEGHEGSIVALASESRHFLISSAADTTMRLWDKHSGSLLRVIFGHSKSVLSMEIGPTWLLTGSADFEVRLWRIEEKESGKRPGGGVTGGGGGADGGAMQRIGPDSPYAPQLQFHIQALLPPLPASNSAPADAAAAPVKKKLVPPPIGGAPAPAPAPAAAAAAAAPPKAGATGAPAGAAPATAATSTAVVPAAPTAPPKPKKVHHHGHHHRMHVQVECSARLIGHELPVTCVKYGQMEVLSGDIHGRIFIWWLSTGQILRKCQVHNGPIKSMQFDSVHIVSGGVDAAVCITDIATGEPLQSLRGHEGTVLSLAFDSERILSVGGDNTIRYWQWGKKSGPQDKIHVLAPNETLAMVAKDHQITVDTLMKWNGIGESRQCHAGMKLVVKKGDPNVLTPAEKLAAERELRRSRGLSWASKKMARLGGGAADDANALREAQAQRYHRVQSLALDQDPLSLNNRLFGREKRLLELFPDTTQDNGDDYSLAARIAAAAETEGQTGGADAGGAGGAWLLHQKRTQEAIQRATRYFISPDNEDEWGEVADELGGVMIEMLVELMGYEVIIEAKNAQRSRYSVMGRIFIHQEKLHKDKLDAEQAARELAEAGTEAGVDGMPPTIVEEPAVPDENSAERRQQRNDGAEQRRKDRKQQRQMRKSVAVLAREELQAATDAASAPPTTTESEGQIVHARDSTTAVSATTSARDTKSRDASSKSASQKRGASLPVLT